MIKLKLDKLALEAFRSLSGNEIARKAIRKALGGWSQDPHGFGIPLYLPTPAPDTQFMGVDFAQSESGLWLPTPPLGYECTMMTADATYGTSPISLKNLEVTLQKFKAIGPPPAMKWNPIGEPFIKHIDFAPKDTGFLKSSLAFAQEQIIKSFGVPPSMLLGHQMQVSQGFLDDDFQWDGDIAREQRILRAMHGSRDEYVWSDVLQAHVRIGESLKVRNQ